MDTIQYDDDTPATYDMLITQGDNVMLQCGSVCTRVGFSKVTCSDVATFLKREAGKLGNNDNRMHVIRSMEKDKLAIIYKDQVLSYDVTDLTDVPIASILQNLETREDKSFIPDIPFTIIAYNESRGKKLVTVTVPPQTINYCSDKIALGFSTRIMIPRIWFRVMLTATNVPTHLGVCVIKDVYAHTMSTPLFRLPLPNVFNDGEICMGGVRSQVADDNVNTVGGVIAQQMSMFLESNWNFDLTDYLNSSIVYGLDDVALSPERKNFYDDLKNKLSSRSSGIHRLMDILRILETPDGYKRLNYEPLSISPETFTMKGLRNE